MDSRWGTRLASIRSACGWVFLAIVLVASSVNLAQAGVNVWTSNGPPGNPYAGALAIDPTTPTTLYAGTYDSGVFKSTDSGASWSPASTGLQGYVKSLAIDPSNPTTLYAAASGVFKSTDGGGRWSPVNTGLPTTDTSITALAIDPNTPSTLYVGVVREVFSSEYVFVLAGSIYKSTNGGESWSATIRPRLQVVGVQLAIDPSIPSTLYAAMQGGYNSPGVFKSTNAGRSWNAVNTGLPTDPNVNALAIDPLVPTTLYAGLVYSHSSARSGGVFKSTNGGGSWSAVNTGLPTDPNVNALAIDPLTPSTLYVGMALNYSHTNGTPSEGVFKSDDGGGSWTAAHTGLLDFAYASVSALAIDPATPTTLYAGLQFGSGYGPSPEGGFFKSSNGGETWGEINTGFPEGYVRALAIDPATPGTLYAGTGGGGVYKSADGGGSWNPVNTGLLRGFVLGLAINPVASSTVYAGVNDGLFKSTDGGGSWSPARTGASTGALAIDPVTPSTLYAGFYAEGLFKSTDGGESWSAVNTGLPTTYIGAVAIDPTTPSTLYVGDGNGGGVFKSINGGSSWSAVNTGIPTPSYVEALAIDPTTPTTLYAGDNAGVFKSTNGGASWSAVLIKSVVSALAIDPATPTTLYAATAAEPDPPAPPTGGIFKSTNGGVSWSALNTGLPTYPFVYALAIDPMAPSRLYAGTTNGGVFTLSQSP